jgi:hypothetical protein
MRLSQFLSAAAALALLAALAGATLADSIGDIALLRGGIDESGGATPPDAGSTPLFPPGTAPATGPEATTPSDAFPSASTLPSAGTARPAPSAIAPSDEDTGSIEPVGGVTDAFRAVLPAQRELPVSTIDPFADPISLPRITADADPYAAIGIRFGSFLFYPAVEVGGGFTSNAAAAAGGKPSAFGEIAPELLVKSDWARHEATFFARGAYLAYANDSADNLPTADVAATQRLDFSQGWTLNLAERYHFDTESLSDPDFPTGVTNSPGVHDLNGAAILAGGAGRTVFTFSGFAERTTYENGRSHGKTIDQADRNNTLLEGRIRAGYEVTDTLTPFVEGVFTHRFYDQHEDDNGIDRESTGDGIRFGVAFDSDPILKAELALGYLQDNFDDPALGTISAFTVDGTAVWAPTELVTLTAVVNTHMNPTTNIHSSGSVVYQAAADLAYAWRRDVTLDLTAKVENERFQGTDQIDRTYHLGLGAAWSLNRNMKLTGGYLHEWLNSTDHGRDYTADTVRVDLRFQD